MNNINNNKAPVNVGTLLSVLKKDPRFKKINQQVHIENFIKLLPSKTLKGNKVWIR